MAPRRRCPVCRSKQWHKEPLSGLIACSEGHILQDYRNEATETDNFGAHAVRKRTLKSTRQKRGRESKANPNLYHGARGRYHYFQCLQLLLRKQIVAISKIWQLPPEFEIVCRDLWALHLSLMRDPPPPEPYEFSHPGTTTHSKPPGRDGDLSSPGEEDNESAQEDDELEELLRSSSDDSEEEEEDNMDNTNENVTPEAPKRKRRERRSEERPSSTIAILVLACWTLRIPTMLCDFKRRIEAYDIPYLEPIANLPPSMVLHLTKHNVQALTPKKAPNVLRLHVQVSQLARKLHRDYSIYTPEINGGPVLWRVVRYYGSSPVVYLLTKRLCQILAMPLTAHYSLAAGVPVKRIGDPNTYKYDNVPPEVSFLAAVIMVLKLVYGLDGEEREPEHEDDPGAVMHSWKELSKILAEMDESEAKSAEATFSSSNAEPVSELSEDMIERYIEFCGRALGGRHDIEGRVMLEEYFPLMENPKSMQPQTRVHQLSSPERRPPGDGLPPGEKYSIYNARDILGALPDDYEKMVSRGAKYVGVEEESIETVIEKYEKRLVRWWKWEQRKSRE